MNTSNIENNNSSIKRRAKIFKNRFGHFRAGWRIFFYIVFVIVLFRLLNLSENSFLFIRGENLSDYSLLLNRFVSKFLVLLSVLIPSIVLLKWVDKRPVNLLGIGRYKGYLRELSIGMLLGLFMITASIFILWLAGWASFSFNGFSIDMLLYLICCLVVLVISASYEEILFRGYVFQSLIEGSNFWIALGIFSLLFGSAHLKNEEVTVIGLVFTVVAGAFLGVIYFKSRALWMCIGIHFMANWTTGPIFGIGTSPFLKRTLFSYEPLASGFIPGKDAMSDLILVILFVVLTIFILKAKWPKPAEYNKKLWTKYPPKYGTEPENKASKSSCSQNSRRFSDLNLPIKDSEMTLPLKKS
jgi:membrane protease YdiL (CAAX protease family)